jgi:hypothetical protein
VFDRWWPARLGVVMRRLKTSAIVHWDDGEDWRYDRDHLKFLELASSMGATRRSRKR